MNLVRNTHFCFGCMFIANRHCDVQVPNNAVKRPFLPTDTEDSPNSADQCVRRLVALYNYILFYESYTFFHTDNI